MHGHVQHAYAVTTHLAQGSTVDAALVLTYEDATSLNHGYTAASRARHETIQLVIPSDVDTDRHGAETGRSTRRTARAARGSAARTATAPAAARHQVRIDKAIAVSTLLQPRSVPRVALTIDEAAGALGMSRDHLERHVLPDLRVIRVGRRLLVRVAELERWAQRHEALGA